VKERCCLARDLITEDHSEGGKEEYIARAKSVLKGGHEEMRCHIMLNGTIVAPKY